MPAPKKPAPKKKPRFERAVLRHEPPTLELTDYFDESGRNYKTVEFASKGKIPTRKIVHDYSGEKPRHTEYVYDNGRIIGTVHHIEADIEGLQDAKSSPPGYNTFRVLRAKRAFQRQTIEDIREGRLDSVNVADLKGWLIVNGFKHRLFNDKIFVRNLAKALTNATYDFFKGFSKGSIKDFARVVATFPMDFLAGLGSKGSAFHRSLYEHKLLFAESLQDNLLRIHGTADHVLMLRLTGINLKRFEK